MESKRENIYNESWSNCLFALTICSKGVDVVVHYNSNKCHFRCVKLFKKPKFSEHVFY